MDSRISVTGGKALSFPPSTAENPRGPPTRAVNTTRRWGGLPARAAPRAVGDTLGRTFGEKADIRVLSSPRMPLPPVGGLLVSTDTFLAQRVRPRGGIEPVRQGTERDGISLIAGMTERCDSAIGVLTGGALHHLVPRTVRSKALPKEFGAAWPLVRTDIWAESDRDFGAASGDQPALHQGRQSEYLVLGPERPDGGIPPEVESPQLGRARNAYFDGRPKRA